MVFTIDTYPVGGHFPKVSWGEGQFPSPEAIEPADDGGVGRSGLNAGVPVDGAVLPDKIVWNEAADNLPPDFDATPVLNISERARATIEQLEPGTHQFFAVDYVWPSGEPIETRYWWVICNRLNSIDPDHSNMVMNPYRWFIPPKDAARRKYPMPDHVNPDLPGKYVIDSSQCEGHHFWREMHTSAGMALMSDAAWQAIQNNDLTGLRPQELEVI